METERCRLDHQHGGIGEQVVGVGIELLVLRGLLSSLASAGGAAVLAELRLGLVAPVVHQQGDLLFVM